MKMGGTSSGSMLSRALGENNAVSWSRGGPRITVRVPVEVDLEIEVDLQDDDQLEIELSW